MLKAEFTVRVSGKPTVLVGLEALFSSLKLAVKACAPVGALDDTGFP